MQEWRDYKLTWNASEYGGVSSVSIPASQIWTPDVVLYNRCVWTNPLMLQVVSRPNSVCTFIHFTFIVAVSKIYQINYMPLSIVILIFFWLQMADVQHHSLSSQISMQMGMGSEQISRYGSLKKILWISDSEAGMKEEKSGGVVGVDAMWCNVFALLPSYYEWSFSDVACIAPTKTWRQSLIRAWNRTCTCSLTVLVYGFHQAGFRCRVP